MSEKLPKRTSGFLEHAERMALFEAALKDGVDMEKFKPAFDAAFKSALKESGESLDGEEIGETTEADATKAEIEDLPDKDVRYTDAEILGGSYKTKRLIHESTGNSIRAAGYAAARFKNMLETPGKLRQRFMVFVAEKRHDRSKSKLDKISHLPEGNRLRVRREAKHERATARLESVRGALEERTTRMKERVSSVGERHKDRKNEYVAELVDRKSTAIARRELRRELKSQGAGPIETIKIAGRGPIKGELFKETPQEELRRFGRLARTLELSSDQLRDAERVEKNLDTRKISLESKIKDNDSLIVDQKAAIVAAKNKLESIKDVGSDDGLVAKNIRLMELYGERDSLPDDDVEKSVIQNKIDSVETDIKNTEASIKSLESTIKNAITLINELTNEKPRIEEQIRLLTTKRSEQTIKTEETRKIYQEDTNARDEAAREVLTN